MQECATTQERVSPLEDDIFAFKNISKKLLSFETELFATKWFDYRMMTPYQATMTYIDAFNTVYRQYFATEFDRGRSAYVWGAGVSKMLAGIENGDSHAKKKLSGLWRGRQVADALGMPYLDYVHMAMGRRLRFWQQNSLPRPDQIYAAMDVEWVQGRWEEAQAAKLYIAEHPVYMLQNYCGLAQQDDYHEWLFKQAFMRANPFQQLAIFVNEDRLPLDKVEFRVEPDLIDRVHRYIQ